MIKIAKFTKIIISNTFYCSELSIPRIISREDGFMFSCLQVTMSRGLVCVHISMVASILMLRLAAPCWASWTLVIYIVPTGVAVHPIVVSFVWIWLIVPITSTILIVVCERWDGSCPCCCRCWQGCCGLLLVTSLFKIVATSTATSISAVPYA